MHTTPLAFVLLLVSNTLAVSSKNLEDILKDILNPVQLKNTSSFDIEKFLNGYGYPLENHEVVTNDGYILGIHRIPHGKSEAANKEKPTVFIMHGLDSSSVDFFVLGPDKSLALMLADQGYDVWLGNNRGNTWSRRHISLDPNKNKTFWDYSFHELGLYDATATVDYILNVTGKDEISYIGHSQGATQFFVMASTLPEYNDKIKVMFALAPPVFMQNLANPVIQIVKDYYTIFELATNILHLTEIFPHSGIFTQVLKEFCRTPPTYQEICITFFFSLLGFDSQELNRTEFTIFVENFPAGTSLKEYKHFLQEVKSGHFRQYDYGWIKNMMRYRKMEPPDYDLSKITIPIALYYGENDWLVGTPDVDRLAKKLPNVIKNHLIDYKRFNHGDFLIAKDVVSLLYSDVINLLNEYNRYNPNTSTTVEPSTITTSRTTNTSTSDSTTPYPATTPSSSPKLWIQMGWIYFLLVTVKLAE